jgi:putative intracellular protease/amidase
MSRLTQPLTDRFVLRALVSGPTQEVFHTQDRFELLVIPGGAKGAETLSKNPHVQRLIQGYIAADKYVGMICAG